MAADTPFANLSLPSFEDEGPADSPREELLSFVSLGPKDFSGVPAAISRRSLDNAYLDSSACGAAVAGGEGGGGSSCLVRSHTVGSPFGVGEMLNHINSSKLAGQEPLLRAGSAGPGGPLTITDASNHNIKWIQPSGARQPGQGCEDVEQGIVFAEQTPTGGAVMRITLLAAGFIIGPSGSSVRDLCRLCGSDVKSWTCEGDSVCSRPTRQFQVEGPPLSVARTLEVMCDAVKRYKELCEGKYAGQSVARVQHVSGIDFFYQPPPRNIVPFAASLKSQGSAKRQGSGSLSRKGSAGGHPHHPHHHHHHHGHHEHGRPDHGRPPAGPSYKDAITRASSGSLPAPAPAPAPDSQRPLGPGMARSSSLPPPSRGAPSPAHTTGDARPPHPSGRGSRPGSRPSSSRAEQVPNGSAPKDDSSSEGGMGASSDSASELPSPFSVVLAGEQQERPGSSGLATATPAPKEKERRRSSGEHAQPTPTLAAARTLDKNDVLRTVFAGMADPSQPPAPQPPLSKEAAAALPPWLQQLALQQQQQLSATAATAQALFPSQGSLLSELVGEAMPSEHFASAFGAGPGGSAPQQHLDADGQLQAALATMGLSSPWGSAPPLLGGGGGERQGLPGMGGNAASGTGSDWALSAAALGALQASLLPAGGPLSSNNSPYLPQRAGQSLMPGQALVGPGTPTPSPFPATPYPSPDVPDHRQLLAALQAMSARPASLGAGSSPDRAMGGSPGALMPQAPASSLNQSPLASGPPPYSSPSSMSSPYSPAAEIPSCAGLRLTSAFGLPAPIPCPLPIARVTTGPLGRGASHYSESPVLLDLAPSMPGSGTTSAFASAFAAPSPPGVHPYSLSRASSLALAEGPTQGPLGNSTARSLSMPLRQAGSQHAQHDPWADLLSAAVEGAEAGLLAGVGQGSSPGGKGL